MDETSLVLKQEDQAEAFHILSNTYRKHNPTSVLQTRACGVYTEAGYLLQEHVLILYQGY
jgi:hypothetical protein